MRSFWGDVAGFLVGDPPVVIVDPDLCNEGDVVVLPFSTGIPDGER